MSSYIPRIENFPCTNWALQTIQDPSREKTDGRVSWVARSAINTIALIFAGLTDIVAAPLCLLARQFRVEVGIHLAHETTAQKRWPTLPTDIVNNTMPTPEKKGVLLSGAVKGADTTFGECTKRAGMDVIHLLAPDAQADEQAAQEQQEALYQLPADILHSKPVNTAFDRAANVRVLGENRKDAD